MRRTSTSKWNLAGGIFSFQMVLVVFSKPSQPSEGGKNLPFRIPQGGETSFPQVLVLLCIVLSASASTQVNLMSGSYVSNVVFSRKNNRMLYASYLFLLCRGSVLSLESPCSSGAPTQSCTLPLKCPDPSPSKLKSWCMPPSTSLPSTNKFRINHRIAYLNEQIWVKNSQQICRSASQEKIRDGKVIVCSIEHSFYE